MTQPEDEVFILHSKRGNWIASRYYMSLYQYAEKPRRAFLRRCA
jgi:hypothetical protein